jgi:aspartokinase
MKGMKDDVRRDVASVVVSAAIALTNELLMFARLRNDVLSVLSLLIVAPRVKPLFLRPL